MTDSNYPVINVPSKYRNLPNFQAGAYDASTLRLAIALADVFLLDGVASGGSGGGGITQEQVQAAIQNAANIAEIQQELAKLLEEGTPINGESLETGGSKALGWLSSIRKLISNRLQPGVKTAADSISVTLSPDGQFATNFGQANSSVATSPTANTGLISLVKWFNSRLNDVWNLLNSGNQKSLVRNISNKFRDDFAGNALNPAVWQTIQTGAGQTVSVSNSELTIAAGTTANSETIIRSLVGFTIPMRVMFTAYLSQRIINQEFYLEITDSSGNNVVRLQLSGTNNALSNFQTVNNGSSLSATTFITNVTSSYQIFEFDVGIDAVDIYCRSVDSTNSRGTGATKTRFIPDPNQNYFIQIRVRNLASPPATPTTLFIDSISVQDVEEFAAEITGGRGSGNISASIPVSVVNAPGVNIANNVVLNPSTNSIGDVGVRYRNDANNAATPIQVNSAAGTNATNIKGNGGRVLGISLLNTAAAPRYLKFHNTNGTPTAGSGVFHMIPLAVGPNNLALEGGVAGHSLGIGYTITLNPAFSDTTPIGAGEITGSIYIA